MKKTILVIAASLLTFGAYAQKPVAGDVTGEVQLNFQTGADKISIESPVLKGRYFLQDKIAIRGRFGVVSDKTTQDVQESGGSGTGSVEMKESSFTIAAGIEKHFTGTSRLSPYIGAELAFTSSSSTEDLSNASYDSQTGFYYYDNGYSSSWEQKGSEFGLNLVAGADYYFTDRVYLGIEVAWGFSSANDGDIDYSVTTPSGSSSSTIPGGKSSGLSLTPNSGMRLGFCF